MFDMNDKLREQINLSLDMAAMGTFVTPYNALEAVRNVLQEFHIFVPRMIPLAGNEGFKSWPLNQFVEPMGAKDTGEINIKAEMPYHLFFEYKLDEEAWYNVFTEIVTGEELEEILTDIGQEQSNG
jgi:hypothetical protein